MDYLEMWSVLHQQPRFRSAELYIPATPMERGTATNAPIAPYLVTISLLDRDLKDGLKPNPSKSCVCPLDRRDASARNFLLEELSATELHRSRSPKIDL
jgi:hypothetical protein